MITRGFQTQAGQALQFEVKDTTAPNDMNSNFVNQVAEFLSTQIENAVCNVTSSSTELINPTTISSAINDLKDVTVNLLQSHDDPLPDHATMACLQENFLTPSIFAADAGDFQQYILIGLIVSVLTTILGLAIYCTVKDKTLNESTSSDIESSLPGDLQGHVPPSIFTGPVTLYGTVPQNPNAASEQQQSTAAYNSVINQFKSA